MKEDSDKMSEGLLEAEKFRVLGLLAAGIAHEINNPTNFLKLNLPALRDYLNALLPLLDESVSRQPGLSFFGMSYDEFRKDLFRLVENMEHGCDRITATVQSLREFIQRVRHGQRSTSDLRQIAKRAVDLARAEVMRNVRSLEIEEPGAPVPVRTNSGALEIVLIKLLLHACRAADKKESWIRVRVVPADPEGGAAPFVEVADNGRRLSAGELRQILDAQPLSCPDPETAASPGLLVCKALMPEVDGRLEVGTAPGEGSVFRVRLNRASTPEPEG